MTYFKLLPLSIIETITQRTFVFIFSRSRHRVANIFENRRDNSYFGGIFYSCNVISSTLCLDMCAYEPYHNKV